MRCTGETYWYFFSPVCMRLWLDRTCEYAKVFPQMLHAYGRSPVWILTVNIGFVTLKWFKSVGIYLMVTFRASRDYQNRKISYHSICMRTVFVQYAENAFNIIIELLLTTQMWIIIEWVTVFATYRSHVTAQFEIDNETFSTDATNKRFLVAMTPHMTVW